MAKRIAKNFIDVLLSRVDIINVIHARVPLKKGGKDFQACCPFHNEKTPSFTVSPQKQFFHCFGCGANGNAIGFLMDYEHLSFVDAVEKLAEESGVEVEYERFDEAKARQRKTLYDLLAETAALYEQNLFTEQGKAARQYIAERQLDKETIAKFRLGYSLAGNTLQSHFGRHTTPEDLEKAGLLSRGDSGFYDQFRGRLMFPIRDPRGRVIGFGARALGDAQPKYLNSKETEVFLKRYVLYGLYETLQSTRKIEHLIVVEGYMDVIALQQSGINGAVAALGTAFTPEHLALVQQYTKKIFICFDGDNAGKKAAIRAMETILPAMRIDLNIRVVFLPDGEDPDTLVRKIGKVAFSQLLQQGQRFSEFVLTTLIDASNLDFVEGRGEVAARAKTLFDGLPDGEYKSLLYQEVTQRLGMDVYQLAGGLHRQRPVPDEENRRTVAYRPTRGYQSTAESKLIRLLLAFPEFSDYVHHLGLLSHSQSGDVSLFTRLVMLLQVNPSCYTDVEHLLPLLDAPVQQRLQAIMHNEQLIEKVAVHETIEARKERLKIEFIEGVNHLLNRLLRKIS
ncbi:MAG: DNA primase [Gammaproteobacteria bacterium]|nr:MAG: DNA primase [Gammaproteobacteria bacterium]